MTEIEQAAKLLAEQPEIRDPGGKKLTPEQLQTLAKEVLRLMRDELRGDLERRGLENGRRRGERR